MFKYLYTDAVNLAMDMHSWEPEKYPDIEKLTQELWEEMLAENLACF